MWPFGLSALAQGTWVGRATIGDVVRRDVADLVLALRNVREAGRAKAEFVDSIKTARSAFCATATTPERRAPAEKQFAELLQQKDHYLLMMALITGPAPAQGMGLYKAFEVISGGELDGGAPKSAQGSFNRWVGAMRASVGNPGTATEQKVAQALVDNAGLYEHYKADRDRAEIVGCEDGRAREAALPAARQAIANSMKDGGRKLHAQSVVAFNAKKHLNVGASFNSGGDRRLLALLSESVGPSGPQVLDCAYGPVESQDDGPRLKLLYIQFRFWHHSVPPRLDEMIKASRHALVFTGDKEVSQLVMALDACPDTTTAANLAITSAHKALAAARPSAGSTFKQHQADSATRHDERRAESRKRQCAALAARVESARQLVAGAASPQQARGGQMQLQSWERRYASACGG